MKQTNTTTTRRRNGIGVLELTTATGIIAILIGLLLPAVQKVREAANRNSAAATVNQLAAAVQARYDKSKTLPGSLGELLPAVNMSHPAKSGYLFTQLEASAKRFAVDALPAAGFTGSELIHLEANLANGALKISTSTARIATADAARQQAYLNIAVEAAKSFAALAGLLPSAEKDVLYQSIRQHVDSPATAQDAFARLKGTDGRVTLKSISDAMNGGNFLFGDGSVRFIMQNLYQVIARELRFGANDEAWESYGISTVPTAWEGTRLFSYDGVIAIANRTAVDATTANWATALLQQAQSAEARGDLAAEQKAKSQVIDGTSNTIMFGEATAGIIAILIGL
ncbi:MAG: hypothetical protein JST93_28815 [Acidobacteria bacterium]|nr:hypothetical protein [Acidobacteriota bacterium]